MDDEVVFCGLDGYLHTMLGQALFHALKDHVDEYGESQRSQRQITYPSCAEEGAQPRFQEVDLGDDVRQRLLERMTRVKSLQELLRHQADIAERISDAVCHRRGDFTDGGKPLGLHQLTLCGLETGIHVFEGSSMSLQVVILPINGSSSPENHTGLSEK